MGATIGTGSSKGSVNVELNIIPFIDLLSCLTAFLLVTAVWSNTGRIDVKAQGIVQGNQPYDEDVKASVHITETDIWVGLSRINEFRRIEKHGHAYDWDQLGTVLRDHKGASYFADSQDIEIAADDQVSYATLVTAMDVAIAAGFEDVQLLDAANLSARAQM